MTPDPREVLAGLPPTLPDILTYVDWFNHKRLHGESSVVTSAMFEVAYYAQTSLL